MKYIIALWAMCISMSHANGCEETIKEQTKYSCDSRKVEQCCYSANNQRYSDIKEAQLSQNLDVKNIQIDLNGLEGKISLLNEKISTLEEQNNALKARLGDYENGNQNEYGTWTSILLACVAIIVTVLGVSVAVLAFWGFNNIKKASVEAAVGESVDKSEKEIENAINSGHFNAIIEKAVDRAVYRGVLSESDFPPDEEGV